jgi:AcrR family transcriptional regulator
VPKAKRLRAKPKRLPAESALSDRRRLDLLEAAYALTAEKGLAGLRTRDVAARAKVNISTLHYYFGTKEALLASLVDYACGKFNSGSPWSKADDDDPLNAHFAQSWRIFQETPDLATVLDELSTRSRREPSTRAAFRAVYQRWNGGVERLLRELIASGRLRADIDAAAGSFIVSSFIIGASIELGINDRAFDFITVARELARWMGRTAPLKRRD